MTHELVRWPAGDPFAIRISVAEITAPAPFSAFAGYRRWLYLLDGGPVTLWRDTGPLVLADPGDGLAFAGAAAERDDVPGGDDDEHVERLPVSRRAARGR